MGKMPRGGATHWLHRPSAYLVEVWLYNLEHVLHAELQDINLLCVRLCPLLDLHVVVVQAQSYVLIPVVGESCTVVGHLPSTSHPRDEGVGQCATIGQVEEAVAEHQLKVLGVRRIDPRGGVVVLVVYGVDNHSTSGDVEALGVVGLVPSAVDV